MSWNLPCHKCDAQPGEPCKNLRTGAPTKYEHAGQRYLAFTALKVSDLFKEELQ